LIGNEKTETQKMKTRDKIQNAHCHWRGATIVKHGRRTQLVYGEHHPILNAPILHAAALADPRYRGQTLTFRPFASL
jgi:hypothetical protein